MESVQFQQEDPAGRTTGIFTTSVDIVEATSQTVADLIGNIASIGIISISKLYPRRSPRIVDS